MENKNVGKPKKAKEEKKDANIVIAPPAAINLPLQLPADADMKGLNQI